MRPAGKASMRLSRATVAACASGAKPSVAARSATSSLKQRHASTSSSSCGCSEPNVTPYGGVIAAPRPETRELFCRSGLKYYARIAEKNIRAALAEVEKQRAVLRRARPSTKAAGILRTELDLAARMAAQSCKIMLWQQALASRKMALALRLAKKGVDELRDLERDFNAHWPSRNKGAGEVLSLHPVANARLSRQRAAFPAGSRTRRAAKHQPGGIAPRTQLVPAPIR